jgi:hypothetical protein
MDLKKNLEKYNLSTTSSSIVSDISTQRLIEDGLTPSEYKSDYLEEREEELSNGKKNYKCPKCCSSFANKQTLNIHQKTSMKCTKSSDSDISSSIDISRTCQFCEKEFASKQMRLYHESKCIEKITYELKKKYQDDIDILITEIKNLKMELVQSKKTI